MNSGQWIENINPEIGEYYGRFRCVIVEKNEMETIEDLIRDGAEMIAEIENKWLIEAKNEELKNTQFQAMITEWVGQQYLAEALRPYTRFHSWLIQWYKALLVIEVPGLAQIEIECQVNYKDGSTTPTDVEVRGWDAWTIRGATDISYYPAETSIRYLLAKAKNVREKDERDKEKRIEIAAIEFAKMEKKPLPTPAERLDGLLREIAREEINVWWESDK